MKRDRELSSRVLLCGELKTVYSTIQPKLCNGTHIRGTEGKLSTECGWNVCVCGMEFGSTFRKLALNPMRKQWTGAMPNILKHTRYTSRHQGIFGAAERSKGFYVWSFLAISDRFNHKTRHKVIMNHFKRAKQITSLVAGINENNKCRVTKEFKCSLNWRANWVICMERNTDCL